MLTGWKRPPNISNFYSKGMEIMEMIILTDVSYFLLRR